MHISSTAGNIWCIPLWLCRNTKIIESGRNYCNESASEVRQEHSAIFLVSVVCSGCEIALIKASLLCDSCESFFEEKGLPCTRKQFYVYYFQLYCDEIYAWSPFFPSRFVGNFYMVQLGLLFYQWKFLSSISTISLMPEKLSTNFVLDAFNSKIVAGIIIRIDSGDAYGRRAKIVLQMCGFVGAYPSLASVLDIEKTAGKSPLQLPHIQARK